MIYCCWFSVWSKSKSSSGSSFARSEVRRIFSESKSFQRVIFSSCCCCAAQEWKRTTTTERSFIGMYFHALQSSSGESNLLVTVKLGDFFLLFLYQKCRCQTVTVCTGRVEMLLFCGNLLIQVRVTWCDNLSRSFRTNSFMRRLMVKRKRKWHLGGLKNKSHQTNQGEPGKTKNHRSSR